MYTQSLYIFILYINTPVPHYLLVSTGEISAHRTEDTEVVNIFPYEAQVPTYVNHQTALAFATGGWVGNSLIVCGGVSNMNHSVSHDKSATFIG